MSLRLAGLLASCAFSCIAWAQGAAPVAVNPGAASAPSAAPNVAPAVPSAIMPPAVTPAPAPLQPAPPPAPTGAPIRIGDISSYSNLTAVALAYRQGWQLAVEEANSTGGVLGRPIEVVARDDAGKPDEAARQALELINTEKVVALSGTYLSSTGLAVSEQARRARVPFVAAGALTDALVWDRGNRYTFRIRPSTWMQAAMLIDDAVRIPGRRWYMIAPNYEYGQSAVASFKALLKARRPDIEFVGEQWPALGKGDAAAIVQAAINARPDAIFNATFGADLERLIHEGAQHGLFPRVPVVSLLTGEPEYLDPLRDTAPRGWIVTGYPWNQIDTPAHARFASAYSRRFNENPRYASVLGYTTMSAVIAAIRKARGTHPETLVTALRGLRFDSPFGPVEMRAVDQQSTLGAFVGRIEPVGDGAATHGQMQAWHYADGARFQPDDAMVKTRRPAAAMR